VRSALPPRGTTVCIAPDRGRIVCQQPLIYEFRSDRSLTTAGSRHRILRKAARQRARGPLGLLGEETGAKRKKHKY
jgi:hypothetical protein